MRIDAENCMKMAASMSDGSSPEEGMENPDERKILIHSLTQL